MAHEQKKETINVVFPDINENDPSLDDIGRLDGYLEYSRKRSKFLLYLNV